MFKSILRTLPSLSGNFTLACKLKEFVKEDNDTYSTYVRYANLLPLQNNINIKDIELNLLNGRYEHDIKKYYSIYRNIFYKENYDYNINNYKTLDLNSNYNDINDDRNKAYEFGCKRNNYSEIGYQYSFYAPIYIDSANDIPEYFYINILIDNIVEKHIKVYINKTSSINYLKHYLLKFLNNVDERVIFCLPNSLQATYFGIDVYNGGVVKYKDNIFGSLYKNQTTINNFDNIICKGFERNNLIMSQIIPISFLFNLDDIFDNYESDFYVGKKLKISGFYYNKNNIKCNLYDFDINYFSSYNVYNKFNEYSGKYVLSNGTVNDKSINVMNVDYPALNESKYIKYEFSNKITPNYCKFKLLYSSDNDPYIINTNFGYSYLQYPNQKYGYFPTTFKNIVPKLVFENNNIILPIRSNIEEYYKTYKYFANTVETNSINYDKYKKLMDNYVSSWFGMYDDIDILTNDSSNWSDVKYNYSYYKGILYNLYNLSNLNIDKFGVFIDVNIDKYTLDDLNKKYVNAKYVYSNSDKSNIVINSFNDSYNMRKYDSELNVSYYENLFKNILINFNNDSYLHYDKIMQKDKYGKYVIIDNYAKENIYFIYDDVINLIKQNSSLPSIIIDYMVNSLSANKVSGYELLEVGNNMNYFIKMRDKYNNEIYELFVNNENVKYKLDYDNIIENLYYSTSINYNKIKLKDNINNLNYNEDVYGKLCIYNKVDFISLNSIINLTVNAYHDDELIANIINLDIIPKRYIDKINKVKKVIDNFKLKTENYNYDTEISSIVESYLNQLNNLMNLSYSFNDYFDNNYSILDLKFEQYKNNIIKNVIKTYFNTYIINKISKNKSLNKYIYIQYNNDNGIDIYNYFKEISKENNNYKSIYVDSYNINKLFTEYNKTHSNKISINNKNTKSIFTKLLNKDHLFEYYNKFNVIKVNLFDKLYVKQRYWVYENNRFYSKDTYISLYNYLCDYSSELSLYIKNIKQNNNKQNIFNIIFENLSFNRNANNKFVLNLMNINIEIDICIRRTVYSFDEDFYKLLKDNNYLYLYIESNEKNENTDNWNIFNFINNKHKFVIDNNSCLFDIDNYLVPLFSNVYINDTDINNLNDMLKYNKISNYKYVDNNEIYFKEINIDNALLNIYEDKTYLIDELYYKYYSDDTLLENKLYKLIINYKEELINLLQNYFNNHTYSNEINNINSLLLNRDYVFDKYDELISIIHNEKNKNSLFNFLKDNNVYKIFTNEYLTKININLENQISLYDINIQNYVLKFLKEEYNELYYDLLIKNDIVLYSITDNPSIQINLNKLNNDNIKFDESNNIYIYKKNNITYGFYYIYVNINNSNICFNLLNDYGLNVVFDTIHGKSIFNKTYIKNIFYILYPFLKINIFNEFIKTVNTIEFPNELEINIKYIKDDIVKDNEINKYSELVVNKDDQLYKSLRELPNYKKFKLLRYFNYITPLLKKIDNVEDCWVFKFMEYDPKYEDIKKYNILKRSSINIYKYNPLNVYYGNYDSEKYKFSDYTQKYQIEYKHFNDNKLYYLPTEIIEYDSVIYNINDIEDIDTYFSNKKIDILYNFFSKKGFEYDEIKLFLFNKYNSSFFIEKINSLTYKVKYKFNLI